MRAALLLTPGWTLDYPSLGMALLKAHAARRGHEVSTLDLGARIFPRLNADDQRALRLTETRLFSHMPQIEAFIERNAALIDPELDRLLAGGARLFGFSAYNSTLKFSEALAARLKRRDPGVRVVLGGPEGKRLVEDHRAGGRGIGDAVDAVVPGEGEHPFCDLLDGCGPSELRPAPGAYVRHGADWVWGGEPEPVKELDALPTPDFGDYALGEYLNGPSFASYFSRGCIRHCTFCDVEYYWGRWRNRSGRRVFEEVRELAARHPSAGAFNFCDSIMNADMRAMREFCELMIEANASGALRPLRWHGYAIVRPELTREMLELMRKAGCVAFWLGIESGSQRVLNLMKKGFRVEIADRVLRDAAEVGICNDVLLMVGYPGETREDFQLTVDFVRRNARHIRDLSPSEAFTYIGRGTPLRERAFDVHGVEPSGFHEDFWRTQDGENHYLERLSRFEELCRAAFDAGVPVGYTLEKVSLAKNAALTRYGEWLSE